MKRRPRKPVTTHIRGRPVAAQVASQMARETALGDERPAVPTLSARLRCMRAAQATSVPVPGDAGPAPLPEPDAPWLLVPPLPGSPPPCGGRGRQAPQLSGSRAASLDSLDSRRQHVRAESSQDSKRGWRWRFEGHSYWRAGRAAGGWSPGTRNCVDGLCSASFQPQLISVLHKYTRSQKLWSHGWSVAQSKSVFLFVCLFVFFKLKAS